MDIEVLGRGKVTLIDHMGDDLTVVNAARVSFKKEKSSFDSSDEKLISYLARHNHWTPFAHPQISLRIKAPISIRTQFFKHKQGFVENEVSGRYVELSVPEFYHPKWRGKPTNSKQGSSNFIEWDLESDAEDPVKSMDAAYRYATDCAFRSYRKLLDSGVAPEQARFVLPQGTFTEWIWTGSLAAYARFYNQRIHPHAQWEIQQYASAIGVIMKELFPVCWEYLTDNYQEH